MEDITIGLIGEKMTTVSPEMTAAYLGSGTLEVFATPAMIALMEAAAVAAIDSRLPAGMSSVGIAVDIQHMAATGVGEEVRAHAEVIDVEGRRVSFTVRAWDEHDLIGEGTHIRYIIDVERFMKRLEDKGG